jgi:beta-lactamase class A
MFKIRPKSLCLLMICILVCVTLRGNAQTSAAATDGLARPATAGNDAALEAAVQKLAATHQGKVALFAEDLATGQSVALDADLEVQTASTIKLTILYHAMREIRAGRAHWDEKIVLQPGYAVGGSGMLHFFDTPLTLTLKDVLTMMVIVSDNTATNLAIDRFGVAAVNATTESLGLTHTHLYKKVFTPAVGPLPADYAKFGLGKTTPREIATLMTDIGECTIRPNPGFTLDGIDGAGMRALPPDAQDKAVCTVALDMLKAQFYRETTPRYLPNGGDGTVASKTGSLNASRSDVSLVAGKNGPLVLAIYTYDNVDQSWTVDNGAEVMIARLAKSIVDAWSPQGLDAKWLVPGLGLPLNQ